MKKLGKYELNKLYLGDCLDLMKDIPDNSIDLMVTDPPYGIAFMNKKWDTFEPKGAYQYKKGFKQLPRHSTNAMIEFFVPIWKESLRILKSGAFAFVMCSPRQDVLMTQIQALSQARFNTNFTSIYWTYASGFPKASKSEKNRGLEGFKEQRAGSLEFRNRESEKGQFKGKPQYSKNVHPTVKPIKLMSYLITLASRKGDIILDPFIGSGTTAIACKLLNRRFLGFEINKEYVEIANARLKAVKEVQDKLF